MARIDFNYFVYKSIKRELISKINDSNFEDISNDVSKLNSFAAFNFTGLLSDYEIEQKLEETFFQTVEFENVNSKPIEVHPNRVFHYATQIYNTGGHTRAIVNWILNDIKNESAVFVLKPNGEVLNQIERNNIRVYQGTGNNGLMNDINSFVKAVNDFQPEFIVLHNHWNDCFSVFIKQIYPQAKYIFFNHFDWSYCLGSYNCNVAVDFFHEQYKINSEFRYNHQLSVFNPLNIFERDPIPKNESEIKHIGVLAGENKLKKHKSWNLIQLLIDFNKCSKIKFIVHFVGITKNQAESIVNLKSLPENFQFYGKLENFESVLKNCIIALESIPIASLTAMMDLTMMGKLVVFNPLEILIYKQSPHFGFFNDNLAQENKNISNKEDYFTFLNKVLQLPKEEHQKIVETRRGVILNNNNKFRENLDMIYSIARSTNNVKRVFGMPKRYVNSTTIKSAEENYDLGALYDLLKSKFLPKGTKYNIMIRLNLLLAARGDVRVLLIVKKKLKIELKRYFPRVIMWIKKK
jgi:hypothetical protein